MSCLKEGLYCSKLSCRVTIRGWVSQDFTSGRSKCLRGERLGKKWTLSNTLSKGCPQHGGGQFTVGLVTNSTLSCLLFASKDQTFVSYKHTNKVCTCCILSCRMAHRPYSVLVSLSFFQEFPIKTVLIPSMVIAEHSRYFAALTAFVLQLQN